MNDAISVVAVIKECSLKADGDRLSFENIKLDGSDPNRINRLVKAGSKVTITIQPLQESLPGTAEGGDVGSSGKEGRQPVKAGAKKAPSAGKAAAASGKNGKVTKPAEKKPAAVAA